MRVVDGWAAGVVGSLLCRQGSGAISIGGARLARRMDSDMNGPRRVARERHYTQLEPSMPVPRDYVAIRASLVDPLYDGV
jgi:hypothetical protein